MVNKTAFKEIKHCQKQSGMLVLTSIVSSLAIVGQAWFFAKLISDLFLEDRLWTEEINTLIALGVVIIIRLLATYWQDYCSHQLATLIKQSIRHKVLRHIFNSELEQPLVAGDTIHLLTDGLNQIEAYVGTYMPQMLYTVLIPLIMGIAIIDAAPWVGIILLVTVPLIPCFMILIGKQAEKMNQEQWERMSFLSSHFLDILQGLTTLKVFGRSKEQLQVIARLSGEFRDSTLRVLRVAFLSAMVLELVATISTALIAVYMGTSLLYGHIEYEAAFFVLLLAPEFYTPFRQLGSAFHTGMAGATSLYKVEALLESPLLIKRHGTRTIDDAFTSIDFDHVNYMYTDAQMPTLQNISFSLEKNKPLMLVGESGSGKTTIANLVAGFLQPTEGHIMVRCARNADSVGNDSTHNTWTDEKHIHLANAASIEQETSMMSTVDEYDMADLSIDWWREQIIYVSQHPHIFEGSLRDNVTFGMVATDEDVYEALRLAEAYDFVMERGGLDATIGEHGMGLSGGERQRIALARAFLRTGSVLILDELTAHLDVETESSLYRALQRLMENKFVILIGHRVKTMTWASELLVMKEGRIVERGTYQSLLEDGGYFATLVETGNGKAFIESQTRSLGCGDQFSFPDANTTMLETPSAMGQGAGDDTSVLSDRHGNTLARRVQQETDSVGSRWSKKRGELRKNATHSNDTTIEEETHTSSHTTSWACWQLLFSVLSPSKGALVVSLIFTVITVFMNVALLSTSAWLLASAALHPELAYLGLSIVGVRFFGISRAVSRYIERYVSHRMAFQGLYGLRLWFYEKLEPVAPAVFRYIGSGDLLGRIMADIETLQFFYLRVLIPPIGAIVMTAIVMLFVASYSPYLVLLVIIVFFITTVIIPYYVLCHNRLALRDISSQQGILKADIAEVLSGLRDIIVYGQVGDTKRRLERRFIETDEYHNTITYGTNQGMIAFLLTLQVTMIVGAIIASVPLHTVQESIYVSVIAIGLQAWFEALQPMIIAINHGYESKIAVNRLRALEIYTSDHSPVTQQEVKSVSPEGLEHTLPITDPKCMAEDGISHRVSAIMKRGATRPEPSIVCQGLSFSYEDTPIYDNLSLSIEKGETVAIVGASGSGKTTLFNLLQRFYPYRGSILVEGKELSSYDIETSRSLWGVVTQDTYIFEATLEENIRLAKPTASHDELMACIVAAGLETVIDKLPSGLTTMVGSHGVALSGGERQRVALARLFLRDSDIILLDEPFEGLDQVTRYQLQREMLGFVENKTALYITHQLEGLDRVDRLIFMDHGRIIESGTYDELMALGGSFYKYSELSMARI